MASADYYLCDACEGKTFYDANIYEQFEGLEMAVLCSDCVAAGWVVSIVFQPLKAESPNPTSGDLREEKRPGGGRGIGE